MQGAGAGGAGGKRAGGPYDESSWQYKYKHGERPVLENITVTLDTKLPPLPAPDKILKQPVRENFQKTMRDLDRRADELKANVESNRHQRSKVYAGGKVEGGDVGYRDLIMSKIDDVKKVRAQHR